MKNANTYHSKSANVLDRIEVHSIQNNYVTHERIITQPSLGSSKIYLCFIGNITQNLVFRRMFNNMGLELALHNIIKKSEILTSAIPLMNISGSSNYYSCLYT